MKLFATFDRSLQRLLASSSAFDTLVIPSQVGVPRAPLRYFLSAVRNVKHLVFSPNTQWSAMTIPLLLTLNPLTLAVGANMIHSSVFNLLEDYLSNPKDEDLSRLAQNFCFSGLPNFSRLTPRLERLTFRAPLSTIAVNASTRSAQVVKGDSSLPKLICFPAGLQALSLAKISSTEFSELFRAVPRGIRSLEVDWAMATTYSISEFFRFFRSLEHISTSMMHAVTYRENHSTEIDIPPTLNSLHITNTPFLPIALLRSSELRNSSISHITLASWLRPEHSGQRAPTELLDLRPLLPLSLKSLIWKRSHEAPGEIFEVTALPETLTKLEILDETPRSTLLSNIRSLVLLKHLTVSLKGTIDGLDEASGSREMRGELSSSPYVLPMDTMSVLEILDLKGDVFHALKEHQIATLPTTLKQISVPKFDLSLVPFLKKRLPNCSLRIKEEILCFGDENGAFLMSQFSEQLGPEIFDLSAFHVAVIAYYQPLGVSFSIGPPLRNQTLTRAPMPLVKTFIAFGGLSRPGEFVTSHQYERKPLVPRMDVSSYASDAHIPIAAELWARGRELAEIFPNLTKMAYNVTRTLVFTPFLQYYKSLTSIDLYDSPTDFSFHTLPATLTRLTSNRNLDISGDALLGHPRPKFKVLSLPCGSFSPQAILMCDLSDLEVLHCRFYGMVDHEVVPFLTSKIPAKARPNTLIEISYCTSGTILINSTDEDLKNVTWKKIRDHTDTLMKAILEQPFESYIQNEENPGSLVFDAPLVGRGGLKLGDCLESLLPLSKVTIDIPINFPRIAESITIMDIRSPWRASLPNLRPKTLIGGPTTGPLPWHPNLTLLHLNLEGALVHPEFPDTITDLRLTMDVSHFLNSKLPASLTFFEYQFRRPLEHTCSASCLPFALKDLPPSLQHLLISSPPFVLQDHINEAKGSRLKLPNLKSIRLQQPTEVTLLAFLKLMPLDNLEHILVEEIATTDLRPSKHIISAMQDTHNVCAVVGATDYQHAKDLVALSKKVKIARPGDTSFGFMQTDFANLALNLPSSNPTENQTIAEPSPTTASPATTVRRKVVRMPRK